MVELEVKLKVESLGPVRERLREIGAEYAGEVLETNRFFDTPDRSLMTSDRGLRIRSNRDAPGRLRPGRGTRPPRGTRGTLPKGEPTHGPHLPDRWLRMGEARAGAGGLPRRAGLPDLRSRRTLVRSNCTGQELLIGMLLGDTARTIEGENNYGPVSRRAAPARCLSHSRGCIRVC